MVKTKTKKVIAGLGIAGAMVFGATAPIIEPTVDATYITSFIDILNYEVEKNGGPITFSNPVFTGGQIDLSYLANELAVLPVHEDRVVFADKDITKQGYIELKQTIATEFEKESLLESIME